MSHHQVSVLYTAIADGETYADHIMSKFKVDGESNELLKTLLVCRLIEENPDRCAAGKVKIAVAYLQKKAERILERASEKLEPIRRQRESVDPEDGEIVLTDKMPFGQHSQWKF